MPAVESGCNPFAAGGLEEYMRPPQERGAPLLGFLFVLPTLFIVVFCGLLPILSGIGYSFTKWDGIHARTFVGLSNYRQAIFGDETNQRALLNTFTLTAAGVVLQLLLGYRTADLLFKLRGAAAAIGRVVLFIPYILSFAAVGVLFSFIFSSTDAGLINRFLSLFAIRPFPWFGSQYTAMPAVIMTYAWKDFGFALILFFAGLQSIPPSLIEAGEMDGASGRQLTWYVKLPAVRHVVQLVGVLAVIRYMLTFTIVIFLTPDGGPNRSTEVVATWFYKQTFQFLDFGYGASLAVLLAVLVAAISLLLRRFVRVEGA